MLQQRQRCCRQRQARNSTVVLKPPAESPVVTGPPSHCRLLTAVFPLCWLWAESVHGVGGHSVTPGQGLTRPEEALQLLFSEEVGADWPGGRGGRCRRAARPARGPGGQATQPAAQEQGGATTPSPPDARLRVPSSKKDQARVWGWLVKQLGTRVTSSVHLLLWFFPTLFTWSHSLTHPLRVCCPGHAHLAVEFSQLSLQP